MCISSRSDIVDNISVIWFNMSSYKWSNYVIYVCNVAPHCYDCNDLCHEIRCNNSTFWTHSFPRHGSITKQINLKACTISYKDQLLHLCNFAWLVTDMIYCMETDSHICKSCHEQYELTVCHSLNTQPVLMYIKEKYTMDTYTAETKQTVR